MPAISETRGPMLKCRFIDVSFSSRQVVFFSVQAPANQVASGLPANRQEQAADDDCTDPRPDRNVDGLLVLDRDIERTDLRFVRFLGIAETAVSQAEGPGYDQYDCQHLHWIHLICSGWSALCIRFSGRAVTPRQWVLGAASCVCGKGKWDE